MDNRPNGREQNVTGKGKGLYKRGEGLNTGPVGREDGYAGRKEGSQRPQSGGFRPSGGSGGSGGGHIPTRAIGGGGLIIVIILAVLLLGKGGGIGNLLGGLLGGGNTGSLLGNFVASTVTQSQTQNQGGGILGTLLGGGGSGAGSSVGGTDLLSSLLGGGSAPASFGGSSTVSGGWLATPNVGRLNDKVASGSRAKYTRILGGGKDTVTMMIYMCGTDLESHSRMGTMDLQEILSASVSNPKLNVIIYTGGCKQWQNNVVSSSVNQVYQVRNGQLTLLGEDGSKVMTDPNTLLGFISYCKQTFPANRNMLILWDHGGGSLTGYGYDEKNARSGSMNLAAISKVLQAANMKFDFVGFDACLMATLETGLMLEPYADYMIASEETEPGVGWYYTNWLKVLDKNTSVKTLDLGKQIVDDFVEVCAQKCRGQATTLSVVDLAELANTVPGKLSAFASGTSQLLQGQQYQVVSDARSATREFAASNRIDQVDLAHLAYNMNTKESKALASALLGAVKYNRTSDAMTNAYGLSIYFPYKNTGKVKAAVSTYNDIGMDSDYARCIQQFAAMGSGGQGVATNGVSGGFSALDAILGGGTSGSSGSAMGADAITSLLGTLLGGRMLPEDVKSLDDIGLNEADTAAYLADNQFDCSALKWTKNTAGTPVLHLTEDQWALVNDLQLNVWVDDGEGFIDLGMDCAYEFTADGDLMGLYRGTWLAIDEQVVSFYYEDSSIDGDEFMIRGRVPCMITHTVERDELAGDEENGDENKPTTTTQRAELLIVFDNDHPTGYVAGARAVYTDETGVVAKNEVELAAGDRIDFLCDYYDYDGNYSNTYMLGEQMTWTGDETVSDVDISDYKAAACYCLTDIYGQEYWTPTMP